MDLASKILAVIEEHHMLQSKPVEVCETLFALEGAKLKIRYC